MADLNLVQDDTYPSRFQLADAIGPVDLTTATTIKLFMKSTNTLVSVTCTKDADQVGNKGWATAPWGATDLSNALTYDLEVQVTFSNGTKATFPTVAPKSATVRPDLSD